MESDLSKSFDLNNCIECRACSETCPSYRNGGIDPQITVSNVIGGSEIEDIWKCMQCHRCTMICPQSIDVAGLMLAIKELNVRNGNIPQKLVKSAELFAKDCKLSVPKGRMEILRNELGLGNIVVNDDTISEVNDILKATGFFDD